MDEKDTKLLNRWFMQKDYSKTTQISYKQALEQYSTLLQMSISEILNEADDEEEENIRLKKRNYQFYILEFKKYLEDLGRSKNTINLYLSAVLSLYDWYDIRPPKVTLAKGDIALERNYGHLITKEEIKRMIDVSSARDSAIIYTMALTGMGQNEVRNLTIKKFLDIAGLAIKEDIQNIDDLFKYESVLLKDTIITLEITRQKRNYRYHTFIPPEATRAIITYIRERCNHKDKRIHPKDLKNALFVTNKGKNAGKIVSSDSINGIFENSGERAGLIHDWNSYRYFRSHGMRKYFMSTIINKTGNHELANYMVGHKISSTTRAYWFADPNALKKEYLKILPYLSIDGVKVKVIHSEEYMNMEQRLRSVEEELQLHKELKGLNR